MTKSKNWKNWKAILDSKTCYDCRRTHGKIYAISEKVKPYPPLHNFCRCIIEILEAILAGNATKKGVEGADWYLKYYKELPDYYISKNDAKALGWRHKKGNLSLVAPGKMVFGGIYYNENGKLPSAENRVWYEADINYSSGKRNEERILFSNDGLIFVTYNHYETFIEVKWGNNIYGNNKIGF